MKSSKVVVKESLQLRFIVLQVVIILLVGITLVSFSDINLAPLGQHTKSLKSDIITGNTEIEKEKNNAAEFEKRLIQSQKLVVSKDARIAELENNLKDLQNKGIETKPSTNENELKTALEKMELQLSDKEATINELNARIQSLQNEKGTSTATTDNALVQKLRTEVEKLETRNALLVKLNNDLKKNNEYLSSQQKAPGSGN